MKYFCLVWAALSRRPLRTVFLLLSVIVAFLLFGLLDTVRSTFSSFGQSSAGHTRLITASKMWAPLPVSLDGKIKNIPGVVNTDYSWYLGGTFQDPKNAVPIETHTDAFFDLYPELMLSPGARQAFKQTRTGALAGETLIKQYGWKIGDKIPLRTSIPQKDGSTTWVVDIVGTYRFSDPGMRVWENVLYMNWEHFDQARQSGTGTVTWYVSRVAEASDVDWVSNAIDAASANSGNETKTQSENAFSAAMINQLGDLGFIVTAVMGAVFFTLLLLTGHTMAQAINERIPELGVLKTLGFSGRRVMSLVLAESLLLLLLGSIIGLALASCGVFAVRMLPSESLPLPVLPIGKEVWMRGLVFACAVGILVGALPAMRGMRLQIVDALSRR